MFKFYFRFVCGESVEIINSDLKTWDALSQ